MGVENRELEQIGSAHDFFLDAAASFVDRKEFDLDRLVEMYKAIRRQAANGAAPRR